MNKQNKEIVRRFLRYVLAPFRRNSSAILQLNIFKEFERAMLMDNTSFPESFFLPSDYGKAMPERVVEILSARLSYRPGLRILDVAHANAMKCHLNMLQTLPQPRHLTGIDIANPTYDMRSLYECSIIGDITNSSFPDGAFDLIWCISALEHFGMDNSGYTDNFRRENDMDMQAINEMLRLLAEGGGLLITVPYGKYEDHGWLRNYDKDHWQRLLDVARTKAKVQEWYFRHTYGEGWSIVKPEELRYVGYYDQANWGAGGLAVAYITKTIDSNTMKIEN